MERENNEEVRTYPCVYYSHIVCPIRTLWKLKPESLFPACSSCNKRLIELEKTLIQIREGQ